MGEELLNKIQNGEKLTDDEMKQLSLALARNNAGLANGLFQTSQQFQDFLGAFQNTPAAKDAQGRWSRLLKAQDVSQAVTAGAKLLQGIINTGVGISQTKRSDAALRDLNQPGLPGLPRRQESLSNALKMADRDIMDAASTVNPARIGILDQYLKDLGVAQTASTGQAGAYGSMAQAAAVRRNQALNQLSPQVIAARQAANANKTNLLGMQQQQDQQMFANQLALSDRRQQIYNQRLNAAGQLGATGRMNTITGIGNVLGALPGLAGMATQMGVFGTPQVTGYGPEIDAYNEQLDFNLSDRYQQAQNPFFNPNFRTA